MQNRQATDTAGSPCVRCPAAATRAGGVNSSGLVLEELRVFFDELLLILRNIFERVDRVGSARRNACPTVDASLGIYIHLTRGFEAGLIGLGMDAIGRANLNAEGVFDAGISYYVGHDESISWNEYFTRSTTSLRRERSNGGDYDHILVCVMR